MKEQVVENHEDELLNLIGDFTMKKVSNTKKVTFTPVFNWEVEKVGEIKYDPFRPANQYTALNNEGYRIRDCATYWEARDLVIAESKKDNG